ncbi:MAG: prepilin-type N-terminal cleavage/methylation domain-containing protein [Elusimicrobiaceae bacterium]|nr:prepilin-type N-terminal cleavage/methylation domain-containing protein [Elusimicrobiaceae bacterium]
MKQEKCSKQSSKTVNKGFTLIELLIVVLIIGILAAIALPQYQMAVAKSKFATMKNNVKAMSDAEDRYYLVNNQYTENLSELDIDITDSDCGLGSWAGNILAGCTKTIAGQQISLFFWKNNPYKECMVHGNPENKKANIAHRLCQEESGRETPGCDSDNEYANCHYSWL